MHGDVLSTLRGWLATEVDQRNGPRCAFADLEVAHADCRRSPGRWLVVVGIDVDAFGDNAVAGLCNASAAPLPCGTVKIGVHDHPRGAQHSVPITGRLELGDELGCTSDVKVVGLPTIYGLDPRMGWRAFEVRNDGNESARRRYLHEGVADRLVQEWNERNNHQRPLLSEHPAKLTVYRRPQQARQGTADSAEGCRSIVPTIPQAIVIHVVAVRFADVARGNRHHLRDVQDLDFMRPGFVLLAAASIASLQ
mmetsp:Transcript_71072/g.206083  ORF Transcript_71072/g.206083 Transcript_71072/m.206083 type:complete len:251 (-) Transcript_71072:162-914(-)